MKIEQIHSSGRYDRSVRDWGRALNDWTISNDPWHPRVTVITGTEGGGGRAAELRFRGWGLVSYGDSFVSWHRGTWRAINRKRSEYAEKAEIRSDRRITAAMVALQHRETGVRTLQVAIHMPSKVDLAGFFRPGKNARAWRIAFAQLRRDVIEFAREHGIEEIVVSADWNVNIHSKKWVRWFNEQWPEAQIAVRKGCTWGTHGFRHIDFQLLIGDLHLADVEVMPKRRFSDHRTIRILFRINT